MDQYVSTVAVVLKAQDYKEFDQLLTIYTKEQGKMTVLAKGVKKNASKLRGGVQLFSQTHLTLVRGRGFPVVINAENMDSFATIRSDFRRLSYASYIMELVDQTVTDSENDDQLFLLLVQGINLLAYIDPWVATKVIELKLLNQLGYHLNNDQCNQCHKVIDPKDTVRALYGGIICSQCWSAIDEQHLFLSVEARTFIKALSQLPLNRLFLLYPSTACRRQLDEYLDLQWAHIIDYKLKTREFLKQMV